MRLVGSHIVGVVLGVDRGLHLLNEHLTHCPRAPCSHAPEACIEALPYLDTCALAEPSDSDGMVLLRECHNC